jgi:hypothetical protein
MFHESHALAGQFFTVSSAYGQKDNQVYFHLQQMAHHFNFPLRSNAHFSKKCLEGGGSHEALGNPCFPPFHLPLFSWENIDISHLARRGVPSINKQCNQANRHHHELRNSPYGVPAKS